MYLYHRANFVNVLKYFNIVTKKIDKLKIINKDELSKYLATENLLLRLPLREIQSDNPGSFQF